MFRIGRNNMLGFQRTNQRGGAGIVIIISLVAMLIGGLMFHSAYTQYHDWDRVNATYEEVGCYETMQKSGKKPQKVTYCDLKISYEYKGQVYETMQHDVKHEIIRLETRLVDPLNPQNNTDIGEFLIGGSALLFGFLIFLAGIAQGIRRLCGLGV